MQITSGIVSNLHFTPNKEFDLFRTPFLIALSFFFLYNRSQYQEHTKLKLRGILDSTPYGVQIAHYHSRFGELSITKLNRKNLCLRFKAENLRSFHSISTYKKCSKRLNSSSSSLKMYSFVWNSPIFIVVRSWL